MAEKEGSARYGAGTGWKGIGMGKWDGKGTGGEGRETLAGFGMGES